MRRWAERSGGTKNPLNIITTVLNVQYYVKNVFNNVYSLNFLILTHIHNQELLLNMWAIYTVNDYTGGVV